MTRNIKVMLNATVTVIVMITITALAAGCNNPETRLKEATAAENTGSYRESAALYAALAIEAAPSVKLPEAQKGKVMKPPLWQSEIERYIKWMMEAAPQKNNVLRFSLDGLDRSVEHFEQDNTAGQQSLTPLDSLPAFSAVWDKAFNPPPPGTVDWHGLTKQAFSKNFSVLRLATPVSYTYDVNIISRKTGRRISFGIYPENEIYIPLAPAEYAVILKSTVDFQKSQRWVSEQSVFNLNVPNQASLISVDLRTKVAKK